MYDITGIAENSTGFLGFARGVNEVLMFGHLFTLILIVITAIIFIATMYQTGNTRRAFAGSTFMAAILSVILRTLSLVSNEVMFTCIIIAAFSVAFMKTD